jgi:hypothetical protein
VYGVSLEALSLVNINVSKIWLGSVGGECGLRYVVVKRRNGGINVKEKAVAFGRITRCST